MGDASQQSADRGMAEQVAQFEIRFQRPIGPIDDADREQRVSAQVEKNCRSLPPI